MKNISKTIIFFGTDDFSLVVLRSLVENGYNIMAVVTKPDKKSGRGQNIEMPEVKKYAIQNKINVWQPDNLFEINEAVINLGDGIIGIVVSYGKIIPKSIIDLFESGIINVHPSLLPKYRGPSPLQEQILNDEKNVGVTIMQMDEQIDHGPIIAQSKIEIPNWPVNLPLLKQILAKEGVRILIEIIPDWVQGKAKSIEQKHTDATFTKKVEKNDGLLDLETDNPYKCYLKTKAFWPWPGTFFFTIKDNKKVRVIIKDANYVDGKFEILKVLPEGKKEMSYEDFLRGLKQ